MANANDTFTEATDTTLVSHTSDSGHTWAKHQGNNLTVLASGDYLYNAAPTNTSRYNLAVTPATAEYDVQADVISSASEAPGPSGRITTADSDEYIVYYSSSNWRLVKIDAGVATELATYTGDTPSTTKVVKLEIRDAAKKVFIDSVERISSADNAITAAGRPGLNFRGQTGEQMDNWSSTDAAASSSAAASSAGTATAIATGSSSAAVPANASGAATAIATGSSAATAEISASGTSTATAVGQATATSVANAVGVSTAEAVGEATSEGAGAGESSGTSTAQAVGSSTATADALSEGEATATAVGDDGQEDDGFFGPYGHAVANRNRKKREELARRLAQDEEDMKVIAKLFRAALTEYLKAA